MAEIQVHASFPRTVALGASDLNIDPMNWRWVHCLTLPLETFNALQLSPKPYKWIRYAIGVVIGAEGDLSLSPDSANVDMVDYDTASLPAQSVVLYYHTSNEEKRRMFPTEPRIGNTYITSSTETTRRVEFREGVAERDGRKCVFSTVAMEDLCDAVHLLGHSKGDAYIANYTRRRSRDPNGDDIVEDIDDIRNGLFLNVYTHKGLLCSAVAFLQTPNFAMSTSDIDPTAPPAEKRCTAHLFRPNMPEFLGLGHQTSTQLPGAPLRISDSPEWPPAILFDAVYAGAVLHNFGTQTLKDEVSATWEDSFYPDGAVTAAHADYYDPPTEIDAFDMLMTLPYIMVPPDEVKDMQRDAEEKARAMEQRRVKDKVDTWMKQMSSE